ncbi:MerR family transcriptional regulator [Pseudonocardia sp. HH130630-07]|uniref:MerR family transcriptional regulator n=1 Tax=Pseudonocardia sp. HH130630-07 TaxID=1690815 RepID=UPI0008150505|nr:MerR family transcriptional regulator [Pseudonocardia sp. HH130630-07]ANY05812.1 MerR family transcriptional regulator [Pseudonocardia sp. HH130630-07]
MTTSPEPGPTRGGLTIGQAAAFAGVTIKTIRHYHRSGLLDEPRRDRSGYRRYSSADLYRLVQVRTLAEAGVALAEIGDLLDADPEAFADTVADVGRQLDDRIAALLARRELLHRLADGDRALLPDRACAVLERFTALGFRPDYVAAQREALVLARALAPVLFDAHVAQLEQRLGDPTYVELQQRSWDAMAWAPEDPRLPGLADALAENLLSDRALLQAHAAVFATPDAVTRYGLVNNHRADLMPTLARLTELVEDRLRAAGLPVPRQ